MGSQKIGNVRRVAERVVEVNQPYYSSGLLQLIPEELLEFELTDNNLYDAEVLIDEIRFRKESELQRILGVSLKEAEQIVNQKEKHEALPSDQQQMVKEIKFLFNVAATVIHQ